MKTGNAGKPAFGILGTNGKTTAIIMAGFIMESSGLRPAVLDPWRGNLAWQKFWKQASADESADCVITEVPAESLRQHHVTGTQFTVGALTGLDCSHLPTCRSIEQYLKLHASFFDGLPEGSKAILNADDPQVLTLGQEGRHELITYAVNYQAAMFTAVNLRLNDFTAAFDLCLNAEFLSLSGQVILPGSYPVCMSPAGVHNVSAALLAAVMAALMDIKPEAAAKSLSRFPGVRRRFEIIHRGEFSIIDDAAFNPAAIRTAIDTAATLAQKRLIIVHGMSGGGGVALNRSNAAELAAWLEKTPGNMLIVTRSMYHARSRQQVLISEEKAFLGTLKEKNIEFAYFPDLPDALESAVFQAKKGDTILMLGGPALNKARELMARVLGMTSPSKALVPAELPAILPAVHVQGVTANPT